MSRIGKLPISIPAGVKVFKKGDTVFVEGSKGKLEQKVSDLLEVVISDSSVEVKRELDNANARSLHGLTRTLINNMIIGVSQGFEKRLELVGVGYRVKQDGKNIILSLGYSHPSPVKAPEGIELKAEGQNKVVIQGVDKCLVGQIAASIRDLRPPEPYLGKGIRYANEHVRRKAGKSAKK